MRRLLAPIGLVAVAVGWQPACRAPTEIRVKVTTDFDCNLLVGNEVTARFGGDFVMSGAVSSTSKACANRYAGTMVLSPSGKGDRVAIEVMAAIAPASLDANGSCAEKNPGCIHVRRSLSYLSGAPLTVPITLEQACAGHPCDLTQTCFSGQCVPNSIDPTKCDASDCVPLPPTTSPLAAECGDMSGLQAGAPYPTTAGCTGRTNVSTEHGPASSPSTNNPMQVIGKPINAVIDKDNVAYVTTSEGKIYAFTLDSPGLKWGPKTLQATPIMGNSGSLVIAATGVLYVADDTQIHAFSTADGSETESPLAAVGSINSDMNMLPGGRIVFADGSSRIESMATQPKLKLGSSDSFMNYVYTVSFFKDVLWLGDNGGTLWAVDPMTIQHRPNPLMEMGQFIFALGSPDGNLRVFWNDASSFHIASIDPSNLSEKWRRDQPSMTGFLGGAVTPDGTTWINDGTQYTYAADGTPGPSWTAGTRFPAFDVDGYVYAAEGSNGLTARDKNGKVRWNAAQFTELLYAMVVGKNSILLGLGDMPSVFIYHP